MNSLVLREKDVCELLAIGRTALWNLRRDPAAGFPARRLIYGDVIGWLRPEVEAWVMARPVAAQDQHDEKVPPHK